ncbi:chromosome segregation ATPase [Bradyrhizobium sp. USDA 4341]
MNLNFFGSYATTKVKDAAKSAVDALVAFDPEGATQAQISLMEQSLDTLGVKLSSVQRQYDEAKQHLDAALKLNSTRLTAAETLQQQIASGDASKQQSLDTLLGIIEQAQPELDALKRDENDVKGYLAELQTAYSSAAEKLKAAHRQLDEAHRNMERANLASERAKDRADTAAIASGVRSGGDTLNVALDAMQRKTRAAEDAAAAANLKANTLAPQDHEKEDPNIAAALAAAAGAPTAPQSSADRLAALKNRAA